MNWALRLPVAYMYISDNSFTYAQVDDSSPQRYPTGLKATGFRSHLVCPASLKSYDTSKQSTCGWIYILYCYQRTPQTFLNPSYVFTSVWTIESYTIYIYIYIYIRIYLHMIDSLSIAVHAFVICVSMSFSVDKTLNAVSSKQRSYRYCCMDALLGR